MVVFVPTIVAAVFITNILLWYTIKSQRNEFANYLISLLEFHLVNVVKFVCEKRRRESYGEEVVVLNNRNYYEQYVIWSIFTITNQHILPSPSLLFMINHPSFLCHNNFFSYLTITSFHIQQLLTFTITNYFNIDKEERRRAWL